MFDSNSENQVDDSLLLMVQILAVSPAIESYITQYGCVPAALQVQLRNLVHKYCDEVPVAPTEPCHVRSGIIFRDAHHTGAQLPSSGE